MLAIYFAIHLSVRAFWLSLLLLQKIYPNGINIERLYLKDPYKSFATRFGLSQMITSTDTVSGLIFAWAVTFVITFVGMGTAFSLWAVPVGLLAQVQPDLVKSVPVRAVNITVGLSLLLFIVDTIFFGIIRRRAILGRIYYPLYLFWNTVSFGFLWRPGFQIIYSNVKNKWKAFGLALVSVVLVGFMSGDEDDFIKLFDPRGSRSEALQVEETRYLDKRPGDYWGGSFIQSDVITDGYVRVFVNYLSTDDKLIDALGSDSSHFSQVIRVSIDDSVCVSPKWIGISRVNGQKGIQTVLDVSRLENKMYVLKIERVSDTTANTVRIPFWKQ